MFSHRSSIASLLASFRIEGRTLCYGSFVAKLYNWCLALGFTPGRIIPSRAFCSDESQGFPIILLAKHFAAFPFNHGRVGGIVSVERHGPFAEHGKDLVLVQASHVGYDPDSGRFGLYRRLHTEHACMTASCGKIGHILQDYARELDYARANVRLTRHTGRPALIIDNWLLTRERREGLFLIPERLIEAAVGERLPEPLAARSTGLIYAAAQSLVDRLGAAAWPPSGSEPIGTRLAPEDFVYRRPGLDAHDVQHQLERNLLAPMPWILTARHPYLSAACANTQAEFDRTYRSLAREPAVQGKNLLFVSGLNIDISPADGETFPLTRFVPWAAYLQRAEGERRLLEQDELWTELDRQPADNPDQIDLERAIHALRRGREVEISL
ncbi:MAG: hypothetical protein NZ524_07865 [Thiobacillaceae bacterium]|nr:hypothetical protein [Thiobacillaceae bacterium]MDW8323494.1 hypothetical protein [Burkholderiales bacterium]